MPRESTFQRRVINTLTEMFPGCYIIKNDPRERQGVPDVLILFGKRWAMLEFKRATKAERQPNQEYYVEEFGRMSFAAFIHPENEEEVLLGLQSALGLRRPARIS